MSTVPTSPLDPSGTGHSHVFLGADHRVNERKTWAVIALCATMMLLEILGGALFGSLALVADGLHMATHVIAILIAAMAYRFAREHAYDRRFTFGTGKVGDLAGFSSAIILAVIALFVGYEAMVRLLQPVRIDYEEAIPIAGLGLCVNIASAWLLSGSSDHHHGHGHAHEHAEDEPQDGHVHSHHTHRDHNFRSAFIHVVGDAAVSVLAILGLLSARYLGWVRMDPVMGLVGGGVIAAWAYSLVRDTTRVLIDVTPDAALEERIRRRVEKFGDRVVDLHLWRLGPGHLGTIVSVESSSARNAEFYKQALNEIPHLSHITVEVVAPRDARRS